MYCSIKHRSPTKATCFVAVRNTFNKFDLSLFLSLSLSLEGLKRSQFENKGITFKDHCEKEHNMWNYLYYIVHLRTKDKTEFTGPESYVYDQIKENIDDPVCTSFDRYLIVSPGLVTFL